MSTNRDATGRESIAEMALDDQLGAAARDLVADALDVLGRTGRSRYPRGPVRGVLRLFAGAVVAGRVVRCEHLAAGTSGSAWCIGDDPSVLRCAGCASSWLRRPPPLPVGCDVCAGPGELRAVAAATSPIVRGHIDGGPGTIPPAVVIGAVCRPCWTNRPRDGGVGTP